MRRLGYLVSVEAGSCAHSIRRLDLNKKLFFFISGVIVSIPFTVYAKTLMNHLYAMMPVLLFKVFSTAVFSPFVEEFAKAYPLLYRKEDSERSILTHGVLVGLGFGIAELLIYVIRLGAPISTRVPGVLFHAASTSIAAYGIAKRRSLLPYLGAVTLHLFNNLSAILDLGFIIAGYPILIATSSIAWYLHRKVSTPNARTLIITKISKKHTHSKILHYCSINACFMEQKMGYGRHTDRAQIGSLWSGFQLFRNELCFASNEERRL